MVYKYIQEQGKQQGGKNGRPENRPQHGNHLTSLYWTKDWNKHMAIYNMLIRLNKTQVLIITIGKKRKHKKQEDQAEET